MRRKKDATTPGAAGGWRSSSEELFEDPVVQELRALDDEYLALERQRQAEYSELDQRFLPRYSELLCRRRSRLARCDADASDAAEPVVGSGNSAASTALPPKATPALPGFWKTVLQNSEEFQEDIEEYDEPVLDYLSDISHEMLGTAGEEGFRLCFAFNPNPYFANTELVKVYHTQRKSAFIDHLCCTRIEAPRIDWNVGKNVTVEIVTKKPKGGGRKKLNKAKREEVSRPSFFRFFFRNLGPDEEVPEEELDDQDEDEEDVLDLMHCLIDDDYHQAMALRDFIAPHAVRWYTGDACDDWEDDDDDDEEEEEEEQDEGNFADAEVAWSAPAAQGQETESHKERSDCKGQ